MLLVWHVVLFLNGHNSSSHPICSSIMWPWSPSSSRNEVQDTPCIWEGLRLVCVHAKSLQSCPTLCNPMDCSPPGSSVQARILEWVAMPFSRDLLTNRTDRSDIGLLLRLVQKRWCNSELASWNTCPGTLSYPISLCLPWIHHASKMTKLNQTKRACRKNQSPPAAPVSHCFSFCQSLTAATWDTLS